MTLFQQLEKIEFELLGLQLVEPMAFILNTIVFSMNIYFAYRIAQIKPNSRFHKYWRNFFLLNGVAFFVGGFGHIMFKYWDIYGKIPSWTLAIPAVYFLEQAMISVHHNDKQRRSFKILSDIKLGVALTGLLGILLFAPVEANPRLGLLVPSFNSALGLILSLGVLAINYRKNIDYSFNVFWIGLLLMIPTAVVQALKLSFSRWLNYDDIAHYIMIVSFFYFFLGVKVVSRESSHHLKKSNYRVK